MTKQMQVEVHIISVKRLSTCERGEMEGLYRRYYAGGRAEDFARDLDGKDWVILLKCDGKVCGFSTQKLIKGIEYKVTTPPFGHPSAGGECMCVGGWQIAAPTGVNDDVGAAICRPPSARGDFMNVLFSGDTIVDEGMRNQSGLAGGFGHLMGYLNERYEPNSLYWFLISKGARTYRFLPTFFKRYMPCPEKGVCHTPLQDRLKCMASSLYPNEYNPETGVLHFGENKDHLIADELREDEASRYFRELNPGWLRGDELCCFAPLAMDNLNRLGERVIQGVTPKWDISQTMNNTNNKNL